MVSERTRRGWEVPVVAMLVMAVGAVVCILQMHTSNVNAISLMGTRGDLWDKGYLWATPGMGQNDDYTQTPSVVALRSHQMQQALSSAMMAQQAHRQLSSSHATRHRQQILCGLGIGCEEETAIHLDGAQNLNYTAVSAGLITKNHSVSDDTVKEVSEAIQAYVHELEIAKEFHAGSPFNEFKAGQGVQQLNQVYPPGASAHGKFKTVEQQQKLCGLGAGCEQWSEIQIKIAEQMDHDRVNQGMPEPPGEDRMKEVDRAMNEQKIEHSFVLPPY